MKLSNIGVSSVYIFLNKDYDFTESSMHIKYSNIKIGDEKIWHTQRQWDSIKKDEFVFGDITHFIADGFGVWHGVY